LALQAPITSHVRPWLIAGLTLGADQLTKWLVTTSFAIGESLPVVPPVLLFTYVQNTGAAFGLFKGQQGLFVVLSLVVIVWILRELLVKASMGRLAEWGCALVLGGAAGNLIDRLRVGYVIDFIDVRVWPVFNVGDSAITIGVALLMWQALVAEKQRHSSSKH
jgi:signal peptidase II